MLVSPSGQPVEVLFDFGTVDISTWEWLGQVRSDPQSTEPLASFTFTNPTATQLLAILDDAAIAALGPGASWRYEIEQTAPTHRQMFFGGLVLRQDVAR